MKSEEQEISECIKTLQSGGIILFPTDTILGIGCDATDDYCVQRTIKLKQRSKHKGFIVLVHDVKALNNYVQSVPVSANKLISESENPISIIYPKGKNVSKHVLGKDGSIAIRVVKSGFAHNLLKTYQKAVVATSVNISGDNSAKSLADVDGSILKAVDYVVNLSSTSTITKASTIIKFDSEGNKQIIRK